MSELGQRPSFQSVQRLTELLQLAAADTPGAKDELYQRIYRDLHGLAKLLIRRKPRGDLDTTDVIQEVIVRFEATDALRHYPNRRVLFSVAIRAMNQVLIDHYRRRSKLIDSPDRHRESLDYLLGNLQEQVGYDFESLYQALSKLQAVAPRQHSVVTYRIYGGCTIAEVAEILEVSRQTVERDWALAKAKLYKFLGDND